VLKHKGRKYGPGLCTFSDRLFPLFCKSVPNTHGQLGGSDICVSPKIRKNPDLGLDFFNSFNLRTSISNVDSSDFPFHEGCCSVFLKTECLYRGPHFCFFQRVGKRFPASVNFSDK